jgi:hypothetical protein
MYTLDDNVCAVELPLFYVTYEMAWSSGTWNPPQALQLFQLVVQNVASKYR